MRAFAVLGLLALLGGRGEPLAPNGEVRPLAEDAPWGEKGSNVEADAPRLAQLANSAAGVFLRLVNEKLKGRIDPRSVAYVAPAGILLEDTVLTAPGNRPVARVKRVYAEVSIRALFSGEIAISRLEIDEPQLLLEVKDGKVNLLEALTPKKAPEKSGDSSGTFRIDDIRVRKGGFRLNVDENVTLAFDAINANASVDVDLGRESVIVEVKNLSVATGSVRLQPLDIPLRGITADRIQVLTDRVIIGGARGTALGGVNGKGPSVRFGVGGRVNISGDGDLRLNGNVDVDAGAWPDRLEALPFAAPTAKGTVAVTGPFKEPVVDVDVDVGKTTAFEFPVDSGHATVRVTPSLVKVSSGTVIRSGRGTATVTGDVVLPSGESSDVRLNLSTRLNAIPLGVALAPAKLDTKLRGTLSGALKITGKAGKTTAIDVVGDIAGRQLQLFDLQLPAELDGDARVNISTERVVVERAAFRDPLGGTDISVDGTVQLKREQLALNVKAAVDNGTGIMPSLPKELEARGVTAMGTISGPFKAVVVDLATTVAKGKAWGAPFREIAAAVQVSPKEVRITKGKGRLASGALTQLNPLVLSLGGKGTTFQSGRFLVKGADITRITTPDGKKLPLEGIVDVEATLRGRTDAPRVLVRAAAGGLVVADERLDDVTAAFVVTKDELVVSEGTIRGPLVDADIARFVLTIKDLGMSGVVDVRRLELAAIAAASSAKISGRGRGSVIVGGTTSAPVVKAQLSLVGLQVGEVGFGDGPLTVGIAPDAVAGGDALTATVAASTSWALGSWKVRAAYAIARQNLAADISVRDVDLSILGPVLDDVVYPLEGHVDGNIEVSGPLSALSGTIKLRMPDLTVRVPSATETAGFRHRALGAVVLDSQLEDGELAARLCAFPDTAGVATTQKGALGASTTDSPCDTPQRLWANIGGDIRLDRPSGQLFVDASLAEDRFEDLIPALRQQSLGVGGQARVAASITIPEEGEVVSALSTTLQALNVRAPGAPPIRLVRPVDLDLSDGRVVLGTEPARFVTTTEGVDLVIAAGSSVGRDDVDLAIDGELALSTLKLVTDQIANAAGTATSHIKVSGHYADGVVIDGSLVPKPGARITPRALGQAVTFESARIRLAPSGDDLSRLQITFDAPCPDERTASCPLLARIGEGRVQMEGHVIARTSRKDEETWIERFNLGVSASAVEIKTSVGRVETSFDVALTGDAPAPVLKGRVEISDGLLRKDFEVRNFILSAAPERPSEPLWQTLTPLGLGGLTFAVDASMQNLRAKARINSFQLDASLRGDIRISRSLRLPSLDGAIEVESGTVDFPRARFEIVEMQLQFPTSAEGKIKPTVHLSATAELPAGSAGNDVEVPVDLALDGTFDAMQLGLTATDPNRQWTRAELFAHILFGVVPADAGGADLVSTSVDVASRAALSELAAPVNQELESLIESGLGLDVNIDVASGVQLQLGGRLVLEGPGLLSGSLTTTDSTTSAATTGTSGTDALRVRLLFYDHLPVGRALSAEGRFGVVSDLRLSWRVFEQ